MRKFVIRKILFVLLFLPLFGKAQLISDTTLISHVLQMMPKQIKIAPDRFKELTLLTKNLNSTEIQALLFLYAYMPLSDLADYDTQFFLDNAHVAIKAKAEMPWGKEISEYAFLHFVLPPRVNNENLDSFRIIMYDTLKARIKGLNMMDAVLEINHWCHEKVTYKGTDSRTGSPICTMNKAFGRCGEESVFTVAALRTIGIPARQVYTPRWAHTDDNHAWVEAMVDGKWYYLGACEPQPVLNTGWFDEPVKRAMLVHTRAFGWYNGAETLISRSDLFSELNLTENYAPVKKFFIKVLNNELKPVDSAKVESQIYNYAEFYPVVKSYTNKKGITSFTTGLGDLMLWANKGESFAYKKISVGSVDTITLILGGFPKNNTSENFDIIPPVPGKPTPVSDADRKKNDALLKKEDSIRASYVSSFKDDVWCKTLSKKTGFSLDSVQYVIAKSYGNWNEIKNYLENAAKSTKHWALPLLYSCSEKDLSDTKASVFLDHLNNSLKYDFGFSTAQPELFSEYVLSPRISDELLKPWRSYFQTKFSDEFILKGRNIPEVIVEWVKQNIVINSVSNLFARVIISPVGVYDLKVSDARSRDVFFVALCRSFNIPARLNPETSVPEFYYNKKWSKAVFSPSEVADVKKGFLSLSPGTSPIVPQYNINFTIAGFKNGVYRTLLFEEEQKLSDFPDFMPLDPGNYMLVTGNRQNDGSVLSRIHFFEILSDSLTKVKVTIRDAKTVVESMGTIDPDSINLTDINSKTQLNLDKYTKSKGAVLVFIDPDKEPSKHAVQDMLKVSEDLKAWGGKVIFILGEEVASKSFSPQTFGKLPEQFIFMKDPKDQLYLGIQKYFQCVVKKDLPLITFISSNGGIYFHSTGYTIGAGEQVLKVINSLNK